MKMGVDLRGDFPRAAGMPGPAVATFTVDKDSSMARLQRTFTEVGLPHYSARRNVMAGTPTEQQKIELKARGLDVSSQRVFDCSPRKR
jgi:hypothetical protein